MPGISGHSALVPDEPPPYGAAPSNQEVLLGELEVFADICCPFTHVGLRRVVAARAERHADLRLRVRAWPLEIVNGRPLDPDHVALEADDLRAQVAPEMFAGFDVRAFPSTSIPAFGLASAAYERGIETGESVSLALRTALFEEGRDVSDPSVLGALAATFGLEVPSVEQAEIAVRADWADGQSKGVIGSPHFFLSDGGDAFCPVLHITRRPDGHFDIQTDDVALREFFGSVFAG